MTRLWNRLFGTPEVPPARPVAPAPRPAGYPNTYAAAAPADGATRARLFDPALRHFGNGFRPGDPEFANEDLQREWAGRRRRATDHVLRRIAESPWGDSLVLRGSRLLRAWFGPAAREPGDLDWVADPPSLALGDAETTRMFADITAAVLARPWPEGVEFLPDAVAADDIWTYDRAPGRRVVFPWRTPGLPGGAVQIDIVFGEVVAGPTGRTPMPVADGGCVAVRAAGPAQSLAWKLYWLASDKCPQGKDLYDAVLLAEAFPLPAAVLEDAFRGGEAAPLPPNATAFTNNINVDWANFPPENAMIDDGGPSGWEGRLAAALAPTFAELAGTGPAVPVPAMPGVEIHPGWLTTAVVGLARAIAVEGAWDRLPILADALEDAGCDRPDLLAHCRGGPHVGGCWVVTGVLAGRGFSAAGGPVAN